MLRILMPDGAEKVAGLGAKSRWSLSGKHNRRGLYSVDFYPSHCDPNFSGFHRRPQFTAVELPGRLVSEYRSWLRFGDRTPTTGWKSLLPFGGEPKTPKSSMCFCRVFGSPTCRAV